jgi:hypothetical protein
MKGLTWQVVSVFAIAMAGACILLLFVPPEDPLRGVLITAFNGAVGAATVYFLGRRQDRTNERVEKVIEQTNGHDVGPPGAHAAGYPLSGGRPDAPPGASSR